MLLRSLPVLLLTLAFFGAVAAASPDGDQKPYIVAFSGSCFANEMSIEYFVEGEFGGYSSYVRTTRRMQMYEIPMMRNGLPARSLKIIVRGSRCRTQTFDIAEIDPGGRVIRVNTRRSRRTAFDGVIRWPEPLPRKDIFLSVEYWAQWKCSFFGIRDCIVGPTRIDAADIEEDGRFKVFLPDIGNDAALAGFTDKGTFELFVRDRKSGDILHKLRYADGSHGLPVLPVYARTNEFHLDAAAK